jgi:hypothetical protein
MPLPAHIGESKPLSHFIERLAEVPPWCWLYVSHATDDVTLTLPCYPKTTDSREMSDEELDEFEASVARVGLKSFLSPAQLADVIDNLRQQRPTHSLNDVVTALDFYWKNDAFIDVAGDVA